MLVRRSSTALFTMMVNVLASSSVGEPLSATRTVTTFVLGAWFVEGVHEKTPLAGSILAPAGAPGSRLKVNALAGRSTSVAVLVKVRVLPSLTVLFPIAANTGAELV